MKTTLTSIKNRIARFHNNQKGLETLQVVLIIAVAAVILAFIVNSWDTISEWAGQVIQDIVDFEASGEI